MSDLYETDPHAWAMSQADALRGIARSHPRLGLDFPHLIEELDGMAGSDRRRVQNLARQIVQHLLLLEYSPATEPRAGWQAEVVEFRQQLRDNLTGTLEPHLAERMDAVYDAARGVARRKMRFFGEQAAAERLPPARPYTLEQVLDPDWWPPEP